jgi:hypothetical protein
MVNHAYPEGVDCVWIASDFNGHVGAFVTGGIGPIPVEALNSEFVPIEDIEERICQLPKISEVRLLVSMKRPDDFIDMAESGLFVYDWRDVERTLKESTHLYEPIAVPITPISIDELPGLLRGIAANISFSKVVFVDGHPLDICLHVECYEPAR